MQNIDDSSTSQRLIALGAGYPAAVPGWRFFPVAHLPKRFSINIDL